MAPKMTDCPDECSHGKGESEFVHGRNQKAVSDEVNEDLEDKKDVVLLDIDVAFVLCFVVHVVHEGLNHS